MNTTFQKSFDKLERQRLQIVDQVSKLSEEAFNFSPPGKWSVAQILTHLLTSERLSVGYMKKKSLGIEKLKDSGVKHAVVSVMLKISQRIPVRYKAPNVIMGNTPQALSIEELTTRWNKSRSELKEFLESIREDHSRRLIFKHPVGGMLNTEQAVKFMYEHVNHHLPQINRLLNR